MALPGDTSSSLQVDPPAATGDLAPHTLGIDIGGTGVKLAALHNGTVVWTAKRTYRKPSVDDLVNAIRHGIREHAGHFGDVGLCVPGLLSDSRDRVTLSVNVPALMDVLLKDLVTRALGREPEVLLIANDAVASGYDIFATRKLPGRLLVLALGTGVGAAVMDDGVPLRVDNESSGHIGQIDVSIEGDRVIGPDGGAGGLEGYIGAAALRRRYGPDPASKIRPEDAPLRALVKAIRICHAIYRPHHIVLAGGLGIRLVPLLPALQKMVETDLTRTVQPGWTLTTGNSDFHAASGVARLAHLSTAT